MYYFSILYVRTKVFEIKIFLNDFTYPELSKRFCKKCFYFLFFQKKKKVDGRRKPYV